jgi:hypothetical protein
MNRMPYGIKPASGIFQSIMKKLLQGIPGVTIFVDDIAITGSSEKEHLENLRKVFEKLSMAGLRLNRSKCLFFKNNLNYLGFIVNEQGLTKTKERVEAVVKAKPPTNVTEVRSFCGLINYYGKFIKNLSTIMNPMYNLLKKSVPFRWSKECMTSFEKVKSDITSEVTLAHFDSSIPITLSCDASHKGIGAVLSHNFSNGEERPIAFISRTLTGSELNYSVMDKEALAIYWAVKKLYHYLIGNEFTLKTDHKPLLTLFGESKGLPQMAASRLQRWAHFLSGFNYKIQYIKSAENQADILSRLPVENITNEDKDDEIEGMVDYINFMDRGKDIVIDFGVIKAETRKDPTLSKVLDAVKFNDFKWFRVQSSYPRKAT